MDIRVLYNSIKNDLESIVSKLRKTENGLKPNNPFSSLPHKGEANVGFDRINLTNGTTAGAILAVGINKKGNT